MVWWFTNFVQITAIAGISWIIALSWASTAAQSCPYRYSQRPTDRVYCTPCVHCILYYSYLTVFLTSAPHQALSCVILWINDLSKFHTHEWVQWSVHLIWLLCSNPLIVALRGYLLLGERNRHRAFNIMRKCLNKKQQKTCLETSLLTDFFSRAARNDSDARCHANELPFANNPLCMRAWNVMWIKIHFEIWKCRRKKKKCRRKNRNIKKCRI